MRRSLTLFISLVVLAAVACIAALVAIQPVGDAAALRTVVIFAVLFLGTQMAAHRLPMHAGGSIAFLPALTAATVAPTWMTPVGIALAMAAAELPRRPQPVKLVFNVAQITLANAAAILIYDALGGTALREGALPAPFAYVALILTYFLVNSIAVSTVVALSQGGSVWQRWRSNSALTLIYDVVAIPLVYCFAQLYLTMGMAGVVLLALILLGARQLYSTNRQLETANRELLEVLVTAIEMRDPYTSGHSQRVSEYSRVIARAIGLPKRAVERLAVAALLHDVGKIDQRFAELLQKPGRLTDEERRTIEEHPVRSAELVAKVSGLTDLVAPVRHHHERWDGQGYPDRVAGEAIPLFARIITFADTIDAMTTDRPYRPALGPAEVRSELLKHRGTQFDPTITDALLASPEFQELFGVTRRTPPSPRPAVEPAVTLFASVRAA